MSERGHGPSAVNFLTFVEDSKMLQGCVADAIDVDVLCVDASDCAMPSLPWWFSTVEEMPNAEDEEKGRKHRRIKCRHRVRKIKAEDDEANVQPSLSEPDHAESISEVARQIAPDCNADLALSTKLTDNFFEFMKPSEPFCHQCPVENNEPSKTNSFERKPLETGHKKRVVRRQWSPEEEDKFVKALTRLGPAGNREPTIDPLTGRVTVHLGPGVAEMISMVLGTRSPVQVRSHAQKHYIRLARLTKQANVKTRGSRGKTIKCENNSVESPRHSDSLGADMLQNIRS
jgi:hypothetical protein